MKRILILFVFVFSIISTASYGQGLELVTSICTSSNLEFQGAKGLGINYQFKALDSLIQFGVSFQNIVNKKTYDVMGNAIVSGGGNVNTIYYPSNISSKVQRTSFRLNALFVLRNNKNIFLGFGPELSYNILTGDGNAQYFKVDSNHTIVAGLSQAFTYKTVQSFGLGILAKIEIKNIFIQKLSLCFNIRPEFIYNNSLTSISDGGDDGPKFTGFNRFFEFQLGLKYNFIKKIK